jgi:hypothetical protein
VNFREVRRLPLIALRSQEAGRRSHKRSRWGSVPIPQCDERERRGFSKDAQRVAQILGESIEGAESPCFAALLLVQYEVAKLRRTAHFRVKAQFFFELLFVLLAVKQIDDPAPHLGHRHASVTL